MYKSQETLHFILHWIADALSVPSTEIDAHKKFREYKIKVTDFCFSLNSHYHLNLDPTVIYAFPTPAKLAAHIADLSHGLSKKRPNEKTVQLSGMVHEPIAIVGMACRLPGHINSPEDYWNLLINGVDAITEVPASRWDIDAYYDPDPNALDKMQTRFGGFIDHPEYFDAPFFNINPKEALEMDPQQRIFMRVCWEALEQANMPPDSLSGSNTGVIVGMSINDYDELKSRYLNEEVQNPYHNIGRYLSATAGRVAYFLDLHGPSYAIDVACASSLVATHNAAKLLQHHEADCVLVGGVNLLLDPKHTIGYDKAKMLSPDGRCKPFDEAANGYVRSEGCGVLVLKRLSDAQAAGNRVFAVIKGSAVNQDGSTNGITAPNEQAQVAVIQAALADANLAPDAIDFIETHGTGTGLGDPIEFNAIKNAYEVRNKKNPIYLGAVKSNIGHLECMSGIAGLIKAVLSLQHRTIPQNLHFKKLNQLIDLDAINAEIPLKNINWQSSGVRHAAVSSFSFIGTNAHVILEEAPALNPLPAQEGNWVICLSAKTRSALEQLIQDYIVHLEAHPEERIQD
jgi:acyl transferase domain-containing protein